MVGLRFQHSTMDMDMGGGLGAKCDDHRLIGNRVWDFLLVLLLDC